MAVRKAGTTAEEKTAVKSRAKKNTLKPANAKDKAKDELIDAPNTKQEALSTSTDVLGNGLEHTEKKTEINEDSGIGLELEYEDTLNYALAGQDDFKLIKKLVVTATKKQTDLTIRISSSSDVISPWESGIDILNAGESEDVQNIDIVLDYRSLVSNEFSESVKDNFTVSVTDDCNDVLAEISVPMRILSFNEWPGNAYPEMLSAFITPNADGVNIVTRRALEKLAMLAKARDNYKAFANDICFLRYQRNSTDHVLFDAEALFMAAHDIGITYMQPPASFEDGQRIRLFGEVRSSKFGTCIDTSCFYATLLENAGINPLIFLMEGHAFTGFWLNESDSLGTMCSQDSAELQRLLDTGKILMLESTMLTSQGADFKAAIEEGRKSFTEKKFLCCIDINQCRRNMIRPLPSRCMDQDGNLVLIPDPNFTRESEVSSEGFYISGNTAILSSRELTREERWENKLLDLTSRNRLLNMGTRSSGVLQLLVSDAAKLEDILNRYSDKWFKLSGIDEAASEKVNAALNDSTGEFTGQLAENYLNDVDQHQLLRIKSADPEFTEKALKRIQRDANTSNDENGANSLFITLYSVLWNDGKKSHEAPLILYPIEIKKITGTSTYEVRALDEETTLNFSLLELMRQVYGVEIGTFDELPKDEFGIDVDAIKNTILKKLPKGWQILNRSCIGNFSFRKFVMWQDIRANNEELLKSPGYKSLVDGAFVKPDEKVIGIQPEEIDAKLPYGELYQPIQADSSQLSAVYAAAAGESFVLQGPPGTGKSQTITNMIASAIGRGKKVLFVAAKKAALEVVQERLNKLGLAPYCMELHSNTETKTQVLERISLELPPSDNPESTYELIKKKLTDEKNNINTECKALHDKKYAGMSVYDAMGYLIEEHIQVSDYMPAEEISKISQEDIMNTGESLRELAILANDRSIDSYVFRQCTFEKNPEGELPKGYQDFSKLIAPCGVAAGELETLYGITEASQNPELSLKLIQNTEAAFKLTEPDMRLTGIQDMEKFQNTATDLLNSWGIYQESVKVLGPNYKDALKLDLNQMLKEWKLDDTSFFFIRYFAHNKSVGLLKRALGVEVPVSTNNFEVLVSAGIKAKENQEKVSQLVQEISTMNSAYAEEFRKDPNLATEKIATFEKFTSTLVDGLSSENKASLLKTFNNNGADPEYSGKLKNLVTRYLEPVSSFVNISKAAIQHFSADVSLLDMSFLCLGKTVQEWFLHPEAVSEWSEIMKRLSSIKNAGFSSLSKFIIEGKVPLNAGEKYAKAFYAASVIKAATTLDASLAGFNAPIFDDWMRRYNEDASEFRKLSGRMLLQKLRKERAKLLKSSVLQEQITYLERTRKNRGRKQSVRMIFDKISDLVTSVCPVMLMSPLSVAQYLAPNKYHFDLVMFDEASQLPTSEAVGAIGRGSQVIVVGDPKQMPPTDFFDAARNDANDEKAELESVLDDCMTLGMPTRTLSWHYRSRHESLIAFSNVMYYEGKLFTFPSPDDQHPKVSFIPVEGIYDRGGTGRNAEESKKVVEYVRNFLLDPARAHTSLGIVTFNSRQQAQIINDLDKLYAKEQELDKKAQALPEPIFVKNLENVQGDERDVIVFSVGFGPDREGKITMNFGPLNQDGGERRLNVAVTRSKKEMVVFSSLMPEDRKSGTAMADGAEGLFAFLKYAKAGTLPQGQNASALKRSKDSLVVDLASELKKHGYETTLDLGTSSFRIDLAVRDPNENDAYLAAIMADGYVFRNTPSVIDRCSGQPGVLKGLGWNVIRFWALEWWKNRDVALERILKTLDNIRAENAKKRAEKAALEKQDETSNTSNEEKIEQKDKNV